MTDCIKDNDFGRDYCLPESWRCDHGAGRFDQCFGCILEGNMDRFNRAFYAAMGETPKLREVLR